MMSFNRKALDGILSNLCSAEGNGSVDVIGTLLKSSTLKLKKHIKFMIFIVCCFQHVIKKKDGFEMLVPDDLVEVRKTPWDVSEDYISAAEGYNLFKRNRSK